MPVYSGQPIELDDCLIEKRVRKIALDHFIAYYVRHDMQGVVENLDENVRFIGTKAYLIAHNREEFLNLMQKEIEDIPTDCVVKVIMAEAAPMKHACYSVNGELEIRIPYQAKVIYQNLRFSMTVLQHEAGFRIASIHTAVTGGEQSLREQHEASIQSIAEDMADQYRYDILTGLYTLDAFKEEMAKCFRQTDGNEKFALLCTDIKHYERINNLYGLKRADQVLTELSAILTTSSRTVKLCCRSVADHFIILVTYNEVGRLKLLLKKICDAFDERIAEEYADARPKLGIGVYLIPNLTENIGTMVEYANIARKSLRMKRGMRIAFYDASVYMRMEKVRKIEALMKGALADGEFKVYYQPKYDLVNEKIVGAEALCRWIRSDGTVVYPDEFIPVFEKNGFIVKLDFHMLDETCGMIQRRLGEKKLCVPVSINQSRVLLGDDGYVEKIASVLEKYNTPSEYIELELTERIFKDNLSDIGHMMGRLKNRGIRWSIDDFGTGYSSLNLLKELPVDIIKIDKSFLDETETSETSKTIIRKTVELTQELHKKVVCEGVETESQADYLRDICCDIAQGYLYAKPMPMHEFEQLLDKEMYNG